MGLCTLGYISNRSEIEPLARDTIPILVCMGVERGGSEEWEGGGELRKLEIQLFQMMLM